MKGTQRWGIGLVVAFGMFITGVMVMVYTAMTRDVDLVVDDYYERGIEHEGRIQAVRRTQALPGGIQIGIHDGAITLSMPADHARAVTSGEILLYRPSGRHLDRTLPLALDAAGVQRIPLENLAIGLWKVQVTWMAAGSAYYMESPVAVQ